MNAATMSSMDSLFISSLLFLIAAPCRAGSRSRSFLYFLVFAFFGLGGTFCPTQFRMTSAISRLFVPEHHHVRRAVEDRIPSSSSLMYSAFAIPLPSARLALIASTVVWHTALDAV